jgi:3-phosphoshikimate 1-carboxyvinyltransferase
MKISPAKTLNGEITLPGDKSISHRAALFSAIAGGTARIENFASSEDCGSTLNCLSSLGVEILRDDSNLQIKGAGKNGFSEPVQALDCGNSGTTVRLLSGILAGQRFDSVLTGDASLSARPMKRIIEPLTQMSVSIESTDNFLPMTIHGRNPLKAISYELPVASAQVKSCILLAGLYGNGKTIVRSPNSTRPVPNSRNHTELMLRYLGAEIEEKFIETENGFVHEVSIDGNSNLSARDLIIPSDISSAAFFMVAAACLNNSHIVVKNVGLNPTRAAVIEVLKRFGAKIEIGNERDACGEIVGDLRILGSARFVSNSESNILSGDVIANLIDEIPILAVFGTQLPHGLEIRNAEELRVKESDRISSVVENLRRMNAEVEEFPDGFRVGRSKLKGATVDSFGDHRIAMAFAVAGLFAEGETEILNHDCAAVSFPEFFDAVAQVAEH